MEIGIIFCVMSVIALSIFIVVRIIRRRRVTVSDFNKNDEWLKAEFRRCNVEVFGKKGTGKDLLFSHVIYLRGEKHYANMPYNGLTEVREVGELSLGGNTFSNVIAGNFEKMPPAFDDGVDFYVSDGGIFLPCQYNTELNKAYPSMPMFFALSRQLYDMNIHVNVQAPTRLWDKLREQADSFIKVQKCKDYGAFFVVHCLCYDDYNLAVKGTLPEDNRTSFNAEYRRFKIFKDELEYDTRYFQRVFLMSNNLLGNGQTPFQAYYKALKSLRKIEKGVIGNELAQTNQV